MAQNKVKALSPEQIKEQTIRAFLQKKAALAEGILFNMVQGLNYIPIDTEVEHLVESCNAIATEFMKVVYNQEIKTKEE